MAPPGRSQDNAGVLPVVPPNVNAHYEQSDNAAFSAGSSDPEAGTPLERRDSNESDVPEKHGVVAASRILQVISAKDIHIAYAAMFLMTLAFSFAQYTQSVYTAYATSAFKTHSQLAVAGVVSRVFSIMAYCVVPKITDNVGRISPTLFLTFICFTIISDAMMAGCKNVQTYIGANVFSGLGDTGREIAVLIYVASTTSIRSRGMWNVAAESLSAIITMYSGTEIGGRLLDQWGTANGWRWGYGMWCLIVATCSIPFLAILYSWHVRVSRNPDREPLPPHGNIIHQIVHEYDVTGMLLLVAALALILVPLTRAKGVARLWGADNIAMICIGAACLVFFVIWSLPRRMRPRWLPKPKFPLIAWHTLKNRSVLGMVIVNFFDFLSYGMFATYFPTFMQVGVRLSASRASQVDNTLRIVFQVCAILIGILMRFWTPLCRKLGLGERLFNTQYPILIGVPLCALGIGLQIRFVQVPHASNAVASFVIAKVLYGVGRALFQTSGQVTIQAAAKRSDLGIATGVFYMATSMGGAIGVAIAGAVWNNVLPDALASNLPADSKTLAASIFGSITVALKYDPATPVGEAIAASYSHTMKILAIIATCCEIPMLCGMLLIRGISLTEDEQVTEAGKRLALDKKEDKAKEKRGEKGTPVLDG